MAKFWTRSSLLPPRLSGVHERAACRIQFGHEGVVAASISTLDGVHGGEVGRGSVPRDVGVARGVYVVYGADVVIAAPQISGINERAACRIQFGHEDVVAASISTL